MAFQMKGSPAKRGEIQGTSGHASALKRGIVLQKGLKIGKEIWDHGGDVVKAVKNWINPSAIEKVKKASKVSYVKPVIPAAVITQGGIEGSKIITTNKATETENIVASELDNKTTQRELRKNYAKENLNLDLTKLENKRNAMIKNLKNQGYTDKDLAWGGDARNKSSEKYNANYDEYQGYLNEIYDAATDSDTSKIIN